jgi:hypothetical protein
MTVVSRAQLLKELLPGLEKLFGTAYEKYMAPEYIKRCMYGKYSIYRWDYTTDGRKSTTLAKGLDKETAEGMMKLLKESQ